MKLPNKKLRLVISVAAIIAATVGHFASQPALYAISITIVAVGLAFVNDKPEKR